MATKTAYREMLKHPNWQRKRLEILERDDFTCVLCGTNEVTLHVHHWRYVWGNKPWEYDNADLATLCEDCHALETRYRKPAEDSLLQAIRRKHLSWKIVCDIRNMIENLPDTGGLPEFDADAFFSGLFSDGVMDRLVELGRQSDTPAGTEAAQ